jgi:predicted DCC family thiol-disulfide oxidoreductase YuxK
MWRDFDGGFDQFMIGSSFLLIFLPTERALSLDNLRMKLKFSRPGLRYDPPSTVSVLSYYLPLAISLGLIYFDSGIHKLFAEHWRNGLGAWLPSTMPYYISAIDMTWILNNERLQKIIGYSIIIFEFIFIFIFYFRAFRVPLMFFGISLHSGIILSLNIYPFGFGMLVHYFLMVPFSWWQKLKEALQLRAPALAVLYDEQCPLCNRTVIIVEHFDFFKAIEFKGLQTYARQYPEVNNISDEQLLNDLYAIARNGQLYSGIDTYIQILLKMRYTAFLGFVMGIPGIYHLGTKVYRKVADQRTRLTCDENCSISAEQLPDEGYNYRKVYERYVGTEQQRSKRIAKFLVLVLLLQLNSTIHYGIFYRLNINTKGEISQIIDQISNGILTLSHIFLGITPHALYLHDHFHGYNHILALTYEDKKGQEQWLPFVNREGRLVAPNWGRVQSMWANVAVTPHIEKNRLYKFIRKVTAFWGKKVGLNLQDAVFFIKIKEVEVSVDWKKDLRNRNLNQAWVNIGKAVWKDGLMHIEMADIDIESL